MSRMWQQPRGDLLGLPQTLFDSTEELIARPPIHLQSKGRLRRNLQLIHAESESEDLSAKLRNEHRVQKQLPQSLDRDMDPRVLAKEKSEILLKRPRSIMQFEHLLEENLHCFEELPVHPTGASMLSPKLNTNGVAAEPPPSKHRVKVGTFLELQSSILSRLDGIQHFLEHLQASKASTDGVNAIASVADTLAQSSPLLADGQYPLLQNSIAELEQMLDKRFERQSALLEKMLLKFKCIDVEHDQLEADQRRSVNSKHIESLDVEHDEFLPDQNGSGTSVNAWIDFQKTFNSDGADDAGAALLTQWFEKGANVETFDVLPRNILRWLGFEHWLPAAMPDTCFARVTKASWFQALEFLLILSGTIAMALEANQNIDASLQVPAGEPSDAFFAVNVFFNVAYAVDLLYHICALRSWFVFSSDWIWNLSDVIVVTYSCFSMMLRGVPVGFLRSLRVIRLVSMVRIIKMLRCFRELRAIMLSIYASMASLVWCFAFLAVTMFIFSLFTVQALNVYFEGADPLASGYEEKRDLANDWYGSVGRSMWSLLLCCMGWVDFLDAKTALQPAGITTQIAFVTYNIFVTVGVMNVLVGVFSECAADVNDRHLLIQSEHKKIEQLVMDMCSLFAELDVDSSHCLDWPEFKKKLSNPDLQAYLATLDIDGTHAHMLFDLVDSRGKGYLTMQEFVMGMVKLRGNAKAIDARAIQREVTMMPRLIEFLVTKHMNQPESNMLRSLLPVNENV